MSACGPGAPICCTDNPRCRCACHDREPEHEVTDEKCDCAECWDDTWIELIGKRMRERR